MPVITAFNTDIWNCEYNKCFPPQDTFGHDVSSGDKTLTKTLTFLHIVSSDFLPLVGSKALTAIEI